jgi:hypothetical protein
MALETSGWLPALLAEAVAKHRPDTVPVSPGGDPSGVSPPGRARAYLRQSLRESGLLYGTPAGAFEFDASASSQKPEEHLFRAVLLTFAKLALDIAVLLQARAGPRREQLLLLFAALVEQDANSGAIDASWPAVEQLLRRRAIAMRGEPIFALALHNGALYADAHLFGRLAIDLFWRGSLDPVRTRRRWHFAARQRALLVEVLITLACLERRPGFWTRRTILKQVKNLQLPEELELGLRRRLKVAFRRPPPLSEMVRPVRGANVCRFILEQAMLASLVDGRRPAKNRALLKQLADAFGASAGELEKIEVEMAEFYAKNRSVVDVFAVSRGAGAMADEMVESIQRTLEKNLQALWKEVRETGELSVLLTRAARGQRLTREERRKMRAQLIDVAKAIPALAIFAAPGGFLLLIALAKVLPFNILPSAFQDEPAAPEAEGESKRGTADAR